MLAQLTASSAVPKTLNVAHLLVLLPKSKNLSPKELISVPQHELLVAVLKRRGLKLEEFADKPIAANAADGCLIAWAMLDFSKTNFAVQTQVRKAMQLLLDEQPGSITIVAARHIGTRNQPGHDHGES